MIRNATSGLVVRGGHVLFVRGDWPQPDTYWLPGGGQEPGATLLPCEEREVFEETGVRVAAGPLVQVRENISANHPDGLVPADSEHRVDAMFWCENRRPHTVRLAGHHRHPRVVQPQVDTSQQATEISGPLQGKLNPPNMRPLHPGEKGVAAPSGLDHQFPCAGLLNRASRDALGGQFRHDAQVPTSQRRRMSTISLSAKLPRADLRHQFRFINPSARYRASTISPRPYTEAILDRSSLDTVGCVA
ncbi:NUDIX domain-containing protein [Streptomyces sp. URMC 127]|uniref:NUDIX domain-containing protein n=1 Tax=Streptomyces sp. URMC 127 TaxID=3423402 RepID=UPI003F53CF22